MYLQRTEPTIEQIITEEDNTRCGLILLTDDDGFVSLGSCDFDDIGDEMQFIYDAEISDEMHKGIRNARDADWL